MEFTQPEPQVVIPPTVETFPPPPPTPIKRFLNKKILIISGFILFFVSIGVIAFIAWNNTKIRFDDMEKKQNAEATMLSRSLNADTQVYESPYWGLRIDYHKNFTASETYNGALIANYDIKSKPFNYNQPPHELFIDIDVFDKILPTSTHLKKDWEKYQEININNTVVEVIKVRDSYPARGPYSYLAAEVIHDDIPTFLRPSRQALNISKSL